jgi:outer membrane beta-barrel protein
MISQYRTLWITGLWWLVSVNVYADTRIDAISQNPPHIERKTVELPKLDRRDLTLGIWAGLISMEDFGANTLVGARLAYQVSESVFFESRYAQSKASETSFETISDIQLLTDDDRQLKFYDLGIGYRLHGQVFVSSRRTLTSNVYVIGSMGNTQFAGSDEVTLTLGMGMNFLINDWLMLTLEGRDHLWDSEVLGAAKTTHNLVSSIGVSTFF